MEQDWTISYSVRRGEIYVFDDNLNHQFTIWEDQLPGIHPQITYEELKTLVREYYANELRDYGLIP